ncbi:hypothetical protein ARMGADRAFT_1018487 [Armillaria gallica]|uniref:Uncharacterized protein n=1 Tax=Armillaria gallica TaxID=47427 RepID=A0A2H3D8H3_ARMGA|nr:hypothetical protein ARMGADRAFT_1018487 [Armillaria gallica]
MQLTLSNVFWMHLPSSRKILSGLVKLLSLFTKGCQIVLSLLRTSFHVMLSRVAYSDRLHRCTSRDASEGSTGEEESGDLCALQKIETELAERYGMGGCVDSVAVFQEAKRIAFLKGDSDSKSDIHNLDKLMHLRMKRNDRYAYHYSQ